jgi:hypothetical protein
MRAAFLLFRERTKTQDTDELLAREKGERRQDRALSMALATGARLGPYEIVRRLRRRWDG